MQEPPAMQPSHQKLVLVKAMSQILDLRGHRHLSLMRLWALLRQASW